MAQVLERNVISINKNIPILDNDEHVNNDVRIFEDDGREFNYEALRTFAESDEVFNEWKKIIEGDPSADDSYEVPNSETLDALIESEEIISEWFKHEKGA